MTVCAWYQLVAYLLLQTLMSAYKAHPGVAMAVLTQGDLTNAPVPKDMCCPAMGEHVQVGNMFTERKQ